MSNFVYAHNYYETIADVEAAATEMKTALDTSPTDWCVVKPSIEVTNLLFNGNQIVAHKYGDPLNNEEILALGSSDKIYNVYSVHDGDNFTAVTESDASTKVRELRTSYARWKQVNKYFSTDDDILDEFDISNEDMSGYV